MTTEGYKTAAFGWTSHCGYSYSIRETDEGLFTVFYSEDGKEETRAFEFNSLDADGIIEAMQEAVKFHRAQEEKN